MLLLAGIVLSFGILFWLIDNRATAVLLSFEKDRSALLADDLARELQQVMLTEKKPAVIKQLVLDHAVADEISTALFRADGSLYAGKTSFRAPDSIFSSPVNMAIESGERIVFLMPLLNEKACQQCHRQDDKVVGIVMVDVSTNKIHAVIEEIRLSMILMIIFVSVVGGIGMVVTLRRMVFSPLSTLRDAANKIGSGDLQHRIALEGKDEFGVLASTFNRMAESIETSHLTLESAVQKRTTELEVVANLSAEVFRGDRLLGESIDLFLDAIISRLGFGYASVCIVDRETSLLSLDFRKGGQGTFCPSDISLAGGHPLALAILQTKPVVMEAADIGAPATYPQVAVIPISSRQRKHCREVNLCPHQVCPAHESVDERCWLINDTLCRSPQAIQGKSKIFGCIRCPAFPVYGVLLAGAENITDTTLHSLEILSAEIASALENHRLLDEKKEDIANLIRLHDLSIQEMTTLNMPSLINFIVTSISSFANMQAALLWLKKEEGLHFSGSFGSGCTTEEDRLIPLKTETIPAVIPLDGSLIGRSIIEKRSIESVQPDEIDSLRAFIQENNFKYAVSLPLRFRDEVQGCITLFRKVDYSMRDAEKALFSLFASQASAALYTVRLYEDLRLSEKKYRSLVDEASDGIILLDTDGSVIEANSRAEGILGYSKSSLNGRTFTSFVHEGQIARAANAFSEIRSSGLSRHTDLLIVKRDGSQAFIDISGSVINVLGRQVIQVIFRDVTEQKRIDMALQTLNEKVYGISSELFFQSLVLNLAESLGTAFVEIGELTADRRHVRTIAACADGNIIQNFEYALAGTPCDNVVGRDFCCYPEHVQALFPEDKMLVDRGAESYIGLPLFDSQGNPRGILTARDRGPITDRELSRFIIQMYSVRAASELERLQSYQRLKAEKDFSEAIFDAASSGIMVIDKEGIILKINHSGARILKKNLAEAVGQKISALHPEAAVFLAISQPLGNEVIITLADNSRVPIGFVSSKLPPGYYQNECMIVMFRDLSDIKKLKSELKKKEYFESIGKVVSGVAHEVRNPLFGISSIGQILERESDNPQHRVLVAAMLRECERMKNLVEELLLYTRPARLDIREIDLGTLFLELEYHLKGKRADINISMDIPPSLMVRADRDKITQVLLNIMLNAVEAAGSCVTVTAARVGSKTEIRILDDGPGIPQKNLEKIFEPFFTTKKGGTGLGLPICKKLIEDHEGSLDIISQENGGTEVVLRLGS